MQRRIGNAPNSPGRGLREREPPSFFVGLLRLRHCRRDGTIRSTVPRRALAQIH